MRRAGATFAALVLAVAIFSSGASLAAGYVGPYPPLEVVEQEMLSLEKSHPDLVEIEVIGTSVQGRPIRAVRVGLKDGAQRPEALVTANIHAGEVLSSRVAMGLVQKLVELYGADPEITYLLNRTDVWVIPVVNPDGYKRVIEEGGTGRRKNANEVDLNRNFPLAPGAKSRHPLSGNRRPCSNYYMGPAELSEPETKSIAEFVARRRFYVSLNGHTVAGKFLYPHGFTRTPAAHRDEFIRMGEAFVQGQTGRKYKVQASCSWYPTLGDMDDFLYMEHGVMSVTIEHGKVAHNLKYALRHPKMFWIANPYDASPWVESDSAAQIKAIRAALEITGGRPFDPAQCHPVE